jgi:hypothetical protein
MDLCDKCGKPIPEADFKQCSICGGYFHKECYRIHKHRGLTLVREPLHEMRK